MTAKRFTKNRLVRAIFGCLFGVIGVFAAMTPMLSAPAYAEPVEEAKPELLEQTENNQTAETKPEETKPEETTGEEGTDESEPVPAEQNSDAPLPMSCEDTLGPLAWTVCPKTGKLADAVAWLYEKIEDILVINPVEMRDGTPIYEVWKFMKGITNIVFIIFCLVMVFSQITGLGITNYGLKKTLPKLIVAAILVNLSFLICSLLVDASNIVGSSLKGVFDSIEQATVGDVMMSGDLNVSEIYGSLAAGSAAGLLAGGIALESGTMWMLIPTVLGAIAAVIAGIVTIALRQAVVALLIMISPLALVAYMLPNTGQWFRKWKDLLTRMLVFYPMFALLFAASSLAGTAIIASASDGFGLLLGVAVQIFPLFFSVKLMKMSGTVLGTVNAKLNGVMARPLAANRAWAESRREQTRLNALVRNQAPSAKLMNFMAQRKFDREKTIASMKGLLNARYTALSDAKEMNDKGELSKQGREAADRQQLISRYTQFSQMHKTNLNKGHSFLDPEYRKMVAANRRDLLRSRGVYTTANNGRTNAERARSLDQANLHASDDLKAEMARAAEVEYENNRGFWERTLKAKQANDDRRALLEGKIEHEMTGALNDPENLARYERFKTIMEGRDDGVQNIMGEAASSFRAQAQIRRNKFQAAADLTPSTQHLSDHIKELLTSNFDKNVDAVLGKLGVLSKRGDTDEVARTMETTILNLIEGKAALELGTYASQAVANYTMFDVNASDPALRRFGKYINMQTAALYNDNDPEKRRKRRDVSWWEYVNSEYPETNDDGSLAHDENGNLIMKKTRGMQELLQGTSYGKVERTAYKSQREGVRIVAHDLDLDGKMSPEFSLKRYLDRMDGVYDSILANVIGDQFSYLSGSEQIISFAKDLTGVGKDGKWDWKYIFGDDLKNPTLEQKAEYIMRSRNLMKKFLGGHVPAQIARSKTDMLQAVESQYALFDEVLRKDAEGNEVVDLERLDALEKRHFKDGDENTPGSYKNFLNEKRDAVKKRLQESFKEEALKGFAKQYRKGYQSEAKDLLIKLLDPETLYDRYYGKGKSSKRNVQNDDEDEDDGMPVGGDWGDGILAGSIYNDTREKIKEICEDYRGLDSFKVDECWGEVSNILKSSAEMGDLNVKLDEFEKGVSQHTTVSQLYHDILRSFFGDN